jgi:SpoIID/LytB domain protein
MNLAVSARRLLAGLAVVLATASVLVVAGPPVQAAPGDVVVTGHGYGHGRGLSQWGSYGYATRFGWTHDRILNHYYSNTTAGDIGNPQITVRLLALDNRNLAVTSAQDFTVGGRRLAAGTAGELRRNGNGTWQLITKASCTGAQTGSFQVPATTVATVANPADDPRRMLTLCAPASRSYRGTLTLVWDGALHTVNTVPLQDYLRGVVPRESPAAWGDAAGGAGINALRAQAVAARSYAYSENRYAYAKTCDSTACQVYGGAGLNGSRTEDGRTDRAVADTLGDVRMLSGQVARTEFSSSSGGRTAGGTFPAVVDDGDVASPYHDWRVEVPPARISAAFGVGTLQIISILGRNGLGAEGGRVQSMRITGTSGSVTVTGAQFRSALGLRSDWFSVGSFLDPTSDDISPVSVAAVPTSGGAVSAFVRGTDGNLYVTSGRPGSFSGWRRITAGARSGPSAVSWDGQRIDLFVVGTDRALWHKSAATDAGGVPTTFSGWTRLGGTFSTAVNVASVGPGRLLVTGRGTDGNTYVRNFDGRWGAWRNLGGLAISAPAVDLVDASTYRITLVGTNGLMYSRRVSATGAALTNWANSNIASSFAPGFSATASRAATFRASAYSNGQGVRVDWGGGRVQDIGGTVTSAVALAGIGPSEVWAFARGSGDSALWLNVATGTTSRWHKLGGALG